MACGKVYDQRGVISHLKREGEVEEIDNNGKKSECVSLQAIVDES